VVARRVSAFIPRSVRAGERELARDFIRIFLERDLAQLGVRVPALTLDALAGALVVRVLEPWFENVSKRQVKAPKIYVRDTGILHTLLGIGSRRELEGHPKVGGSWEGFVIEQILARLSPPNAYYWRTQAGAELDVLLFAGGRRIGIEIKRSDAPGMTPSMTSALQDLSLHRLFVVYPGTARYSPAARVEVLSLADCVAALMAI
jgi:predicted AAA+ superfamily ATPase